MGDLGRQVIGPNIEGADIDPKLAMLVGGALRSSKLAKNHLLFLSSIVSGLPTST